VLEVRIYGDPVLRKKAIPVVSFDEKLKTFVKEMIETMIEQDGVGLAAPQVGESIRLAVIDPTGGVSDPYVLINPEITYLSEEKVDTDEGCLSLPDITLKITRSVRVSVKALDENGKEYIIENAEGLLARALQHEIDHLDGLMIVDHISALQRKMISGKLKKMAKGD
jgi:peptide deformylase